MEVKVVTCVILEGGSQIVGEWLSDGEDVENLSPLSTKKCAENQKTKTNCHLFNIFFAKAKTVYNFNIKMSLPR